jgi:hypothetical protein
MMVCICAWFPFLWSGGGFIPVAKFSPLYAVAPMMLITIIFSVIPPMSCLTLLGSAYTQDKDDNMLEVYVQSGRNMYKYFLYKPVVSIILSFFYVLVAIIACSIAFPDAKGIILSSYGFVLALFGFFSVLTSTQIIALSSLTVDNPGKNLLLSLVLVFFVNGGLAYFIKPQLHPVLFILASIFVTLALVVINANIIKRRFRNNIC